MFISSVAFDSGQPLGSGRAPHLFTQKLLFIREYFVFKGVFPRQVMPVQRQLLTVADGDRSRSGGVVIGCLMIMPH